MWWTRTAGRAWRTDRAKKSRMMKVLALFLAWCFLLLVCWPLALIALIVAPIVWLVALPFRVLGIVVDATLNLIRGLLEFPGRVLRGGRSSV